MAGGTLFTLLDDIAALLDDIAVLSKTAATKTAGVLGDDLALNAQQVTGLSPDREIPVVARVALGSAINKSILVPAALLISTFLPVAITPLLILGGLYLCFEGVEKLVHPFLHPESLEEQHQLTEAVSNPSVDLVEFEKEKIRGAVRTDFILSAEIIVITLGTLKGATFLTQVSVLVIISTIMTIGVYGLVAGIVKLDDIGLRLLKPDATGVARTSGLRYHLGRFLIGVSPYLMKALSIAGTAAMFLVGGGIITHGIPVIHHWVEIMAESIHEIPTVGNWLAWIAPKILDGVIGIASGAIIVAITFLGSKLFGKKH